MGKWYLIDKEDISTEAQEILADIYVLRQHTRAGKKLLGKETEILLENSDIKETEKMIGALEELKDKRYINIKFIKETKRDRKRLVKTLEELTGGDYSHLLPTDGGVIGIKFLKLKLKAKIYVGTCMEYDEGLGIRIRKKALTVDYMLRKLKENGIYIVGGAAVYLICELINTIANLISVFK